MSRNVLVAGLLHEEGKNADIPRFALFTVCSTAFLVHTFNMTFPKTTWQ